MPQLLRRIRRRLDELNEIGIETGDIAPATDKEIAALEKTLNLRLPAVIRELYLWAGNELPAPFAEASLLQVPDHMQRDHRIWARERLEEQDFDAGVIDASTLLLDWDYNDSNFIFTHWDAGANPPIFVHVHGQPPRQFSERVTDYLDLLIEQFAGIEDVAAVESPEELAGLSADLKHLMFTSAYQFPAIPEEVFAFTELLSLNLCGKGLIELPPQISELTALKRLDLANNSLTSLPRALVNLEQLEDLDLSENQLTSVIDTLSELATLHSCNLVGNPIPDDEIESIREALPDLELTFDDA